MALELFLSFFTYFSISLSSFVSLQLQTKMKNRFTKFQFACCGFNHCINLNYVSNCFCEFLQSQKSTVQFTEEFDFMAMNERFKKDEVWGYLGKAKQKDEMEGKEVNSVGQGFGYREGYGLVQKSDAKVRPQCSYITSGAYNHTLSQSFKLRCAKTCPGCGSTSTNSNMTICFLAAGL